MRESSIESKFRDEVKEVGGMAYKFVSPGNAGVPDRVVILQGGKSGFVELKRPGEKQHRFRKFRSVRSWRQDVMQLFLIIKKTLTE
mgnify:CR=1 FL=1